MDRPLPRSTSPHLDRLRNDGSEREYLINLDSDLENVPEEKPGERFVPSETYLSSQTYEALDGSSDALLKGSDDDYKSNIAFVGELIDFMGKENVLTKAMGETSITFDAEAREALAAFAARNLRKRRN